jgi:hypothetical protein
MERTIIYQMTSDDLRIFFEEEFAKKDKNASRDALLKSCENVFIGVSEVAAYLQVDGQTVRNYIRDGLITPELRAIESGSYKFRLSYVLTLSLESLKRRYRENKTAKSVKKTIHNIHN